MGACVTTPRPGNLSGKTADNHSEVVIHTAELSSNEKLPTVEDGNATISAKGIGSSDIDTGAAQIVLTISVDAEEMKHHSSGAVSNGSFSVDAAANTLSPASAVDRIASLKSSHAGFVAMGRLWLRDRLSSLPSESFLSDITFSEKSSPYLGSSYSLSTQSLNGNVALGSTPMNTIGDNLGVARRQVRASVDGDLFVYDDIAISKDSAKTKQWRVAGRKLGMQAQSFGDQFLFSRNGNTVETSGVGSAPKLFTFNDFAVCVDEMDALIKESTEECTAPELTSVGSSPSEGTTTGLIINAMPDVDMSCRRGVLPGNGSPVKYTDKRCRLLKNFHMQSLLGHATRVRCMALAPSEMDCVSCSINDASITLTNLRLRSEVGIFTGHQDIIISSAFSPDGKFLATTSRDRVMIVWDVMTTKQLHCHVHVKVPVCCAFSPDSKYVGSGCQDGICRIWGTRRGSEMLKFSGHTGLVLSLAFSPDGCYVCSASADKTLQVWSSTTAKPRLTLTGHSGIIISCSYTTDGKRIVSNDEHHLRVWSTVNGCCTLVLSPQDIMGPAGRTVNGHQTGWTLSRAAPGAFTDYIIAACSNRFLFVLDARTGEEVTSVLCKAPIYCLTCGSNETAACGDSFGNVYIFRLR